MMQPQMMQQGQPQGMPPNPGAFMQAAQSMQASPQMPPQSPQQMGQLSPSAGTQTYPDAQYAQEANGIMQRGKAALQMLQRGAPGNPQIMGDIESYISTFGQPARQEFNQILSQKLASQGRNGDTAVAHLTPGEMTVPPEVQTPKVLATLNKAYHQKGVDPKQFTVGSPQSSVNPQTGLHEYNFMSAFLPAALGIAGSIAAPYLAPALLGSGALSATAASAIGGGLGTTVGGLAAGQTPTQAALSGLGSGVGGYAMGNIGNGLTAMGNAPGEAAANTLTPAQTAVLGAKDPAAAMGAAGKMGLNTTSQAAGQAAAMTPEQILAKSAAAPPSLGNLYHMGPAGSNLMGAAGSTLGGYMGGAIGAPPKSNSPAYPPGFNTPMHPVGSMGSAQQQLGMTNSTQPNPNFTGYNPMTNYPAAYNFFPQGQ